MKHRSTRDAVEDLRRGGYLIECSDSVDPNLEIAEIQRRVYASGGPAVLFTNVKGCRFPMVSNLFGSLEQARYLFRDTLESVRRLIELKIDPPALARRPWRYAGAPLTAIRMLPRYRRNGPVKANQCQLTELPQLKCWPDDGGAFVTLPQVLSADPSSPDVLMKCNLGMYRVQLSGNEYDPQHEVGLHYQIQRGIGVHHQRAAAKNQALPVSINVGGTPAMTLAAVMPLPEGLSELTFAGALSGRRVGMLRDGKSAPFYADADFSIVGEIDPQETKPEGPFGDHLGYYSLRHPFPVMKVRSVYHRKDAIWPFTVVGRPPQEDTTFGQLIHELTGPIIPTVLPGVKGVHAVDAAGVHPLLLAVGSERYMPFSRAAEPQELLIQANAILGNGQLSLAKYLMIVNEADDPELDVDDCGAVLQHLLQRIDWRRDLHFQTRTTIDTLDYSGDGLNRGSKVILAATGPVRRELPTEVPSGLVLPDGFSNPQVVAPGVLAIEGPRCVAGDRLYRDSMVGFVASQTVGGPLDAFPWVTVCDDSRFAAASLKNWLWVTFTRSNPAVDIYGVAEGIRDKHWGCRGALVVDARIKAHHAPPLVEDPDTTRQVDARATRGDALAKYL